MKTTVFVLQFSFSAPDVQTVGRLGSNCLNFLFWDFHNYEKVEDEKIRYKRTRLKMFAHCFCLSRPKNC